MHPHHQPIKNDLISLLDVQQKKRTVWSLHRVVDRCILTQRSKSPLSPGQGNLANKAVTQLINMAKFILAPFLLVVWTLPIGNNYLWQCQEYWCRFHVDRQTFWDQFGRLPNFLCFLPPPISNEVRPVLVSNVDTHLNNKIREVSGMQIHSICFRFCLSQFSSSDFNFTSKQIKKVIFHYFFSKVGQKLREINNYLSFYFLAGPFLPCSTFVIQLFVSTPYRHLAMIIAASQHRKKQTNAEFQNDNLGI